MEKELIELLREILTELKKQKEQDQEDWVRKLVSQKDWVNKLFGAPTFEDVPKEAADKMKAMSKAATIIMDVLYKHDILVTDANQVLKHVERAIAKQREGHRAFMTFPVRSRRVDVTYFIED